MIKNIAVFCGSSSGGKSQYSEATIELGKELARRNLGLIYGGGRVGLMGHLARTVLKNGGRVTGVIPRNLDELGLTQSGLSQLIVVETMHERKAHMADLADAFIALPGGLGTLEEITEILTWVQLGLHFKPCGLLNVSGYFDRFLDFLFYAAEEKFINPEHVRFIQLATSCSELLDKLLQFKMPEVDPDSWILGQVNQWELLE